MIADFAARSPEINSALMYSGAGAGPLMAAAAAFSSLSSELSTTAVSYQSVISQLTGSDWLGPSSESMAAAAEPYIAWLNTTSAQLQHAASQAAASAAAYETAFAATVPPPAIAANRAQLAALVATNILGQNSAAIAANEALYAEYWAQDAAAMYGYAGASTTTTQLTPLQAPADNNNMGGLGAQAMAVSNAVNSNATTTGLNGVLSNLTNSVQSFANPLTAATNVTAAASPLDSVGDLYNAVQGFFGVGMVTNSINSVDVTASWCVMMTISAMATLGHFVANAPFGVTVGDVTPIGEGWDGGVLASSPTTTGMGGAPVLASAGQGAQVGKLSVPAGWSGTSVEPESNAAALEVSSWTTPEESAPGGMTTLPAGMPSVATAGRGAYGFGAPRYGFKPTVMPKKILV